MSYRALSCPSGELWRVGRRGVDADILLGANGTAPSRWSPDLTSMKAEAAAFSRSRTREDGSGVVRRFRSRSHVGVGNGAGPPLLFIWRGPIWGRNHGSVALPIVARRSP